MDESARAFLPIGSPEPADVADGESHELCSLSHTEFAAIEGVEDLQTLLSLVRQGDHASPVRFRRGRTFSLNA